MGRMNQNPEDYFVCPHCGADVPCEALFCRQCGADTESGWNDDSPADPPAGYYDDDFDYAEFLRDEFPEQAESAPLWTAGRIAKVLIVVLLVAGLLWILR
jgi:predicted amidophosphoribosyltransferase